jgi:hypothetical protein
LNESILIFELNDDYFSESDEMKFDYEEIMKIVIRHHHERSLDLIISEVKKYFSSDQIMRGCLIVLNTYDFFKWYAESVVKRFFENGIIESLMKILNSEFTDLRLKLTILKIFSMLSKEIMKLNLLNELNCILKESMKILNSWTEKDETTTHISFTHYFIEIISNLNSNVDISEINFEKLFNLLLNFGAGFLRSLCLLIHFRKGVDQILIHKVMDKAFKFFEISCDAPHFEKIIKSLKFEFKPWLGETFKLCINKMNENTDFDDESDYSEFFTMLNTLIEIFKKDCEVYISKYKLVDLMINYLKLDIDKLVITFFLFSK